TNISPWRLSARIPVTLLAAMALGVAAQAGTLTIVDLPVTGTDAAIGISVDKTYTHTLDCGSNAPVTINGVAFEQGPTANLTATFNGTSRQGFRYTIGDTRATVNIQIHAGSDTAAQADGDSRGLLTDMIYHAASTTIGAGLQLTLSDLTPGMMYSTRYYYRSWGSGADARTITIQGDGGHNGAFTDVIDVEIDGGGAHYLDYTFVADDTDVAIRFITNDNNNGVHLYGITNEELGGGLALKPAPADKATDVYRDATLSWAAGDGAVTHDVYFGASAADVEAATTADPRGVLVSSGQESAGFDPGRLELGKTYYWRVDEVGGAPDFAVKKGLIWSFTVEPVSYAIAGSAITATASTISMASMGPGKTVDGSGLDASDQHGTAGDTMWLSAMNDASPWIQYALDKTYKLDKIMVWNSNQAAEMAIGWGIKDVTVQVSLDGQTWTSVGDFEFARAPGAAAYTSNTTVDLGGATAKYVKLAIASNWGGIVKQYGLGEVRFFLIPTVAAKPSPASCAAGLAPAVSLTWRPGREAGSHQVFLGTDAANLPLVATVTENSYEAEVALGQTYYWKVVEVNAAESPSEWAGDVWNFSTARSIAVDDFESYADDMDAGTAIFQTWLDGFEDAANGSIVGYGQAPFAEKTIMFGKQSMPFAYDNNSGASYSETVRTFDSAQDWTKFGLKGLSLYFFGNAANTGGGKLYVKINNNSKVYYGGAATDLTAAVWMPWNIDLASAGAGLQKVTKLAIGIEGAGAVGNLFIDDIRLYPAAAGTVAPADPGTNGLVAYYKFDGDAKDSAGTHHATPSGSPGYVAGKVGQALNMTADGQYVTVAYAADLGMNTFSAAAWVNVSDTSTMRAILGTRFNGDNTFDMKVEATRVHGDIGDGSAWLNTSLDVTAAQGGVLTLGAWHHIIYVIDGATGTAKIYVDGALASTMTFTGTPLFIKTGQELRIGNCSGTEYMHGMIDEVRLYNRALSDAEAAGLAGRVGPLYVAP
ncbi:MAG: LamG-like jellyroll fold domain-containing protein, partial [Phycisphaerales bacterium]